MLPAPNRLRQRADFTSAVRSSGGLRAGSRLIVVHAHPTDARAGLPPRVGFVVSKAVGGAVVRNRTKRRLRALVASRLDRLPRRARRRRPGQPTGRGRQLRGTRRGPGPVGRPSAPTTGRRGVRIGRVVAMPLVWLIRAYQNLISPMRPPTCRYYPSCSAYAVTALERFGPLRGSWMAARRLGRCHPWTPGGVDHVPLRDPGPGGPVPGTTGPRGAGGRRRRTRAHGIRPPHRPPLTTSRP